MKRLIKLILFLLITSLVLTNCGPSEESSLPAPLVEKTSVPDVEKTARAFFNAWESEDHSSMYAALSESKRAKMTEEDFKSAYENFSYSMTLQSVKIDILSIMTNPTTATVSYSANFKTALFGEFGREMEMNWILEDSGWKLDWDNGVILPELSGGYILALDIKKPARGNIYDRSGEPIVEQARAWALGITPGQIEDGKEGLLLFHLSELTGRTRESIQASYEDAGPTWYIPVGEASAEAVAEKWNIITGLGGIVLSEFESRYYYNGGIAPQVIGYTLGISGDQMYEYQRQGYLGDEKIGQAGLEKYAEEALAGKPEAKLYVVDSSGQIISHVTSADPRPAQSITTTLDSQLQIESQKAILGFRGAVVVMEVESGRILAMVSSPGFDPNLFEPDNRNSIELLDTMLSDGQKRLWNRATQSAYPLGSVFKIITIAAALESDLYTPDSTYYCGHYFEELPGEKFTDWTVAKELPPSGNLTLPLGLVRSCNPWFYHLGLDLFRQKGATWISDMARGFGLGSATGIEQVAEDAGSIPDPATDGDAVQQGIGQGQMLVTPLQVVRFIAAIANGGTLFRPQVIDNMITSTGTTVYSFKPEPQGTLPIQPQNLEVIQTAMRNVVKYDVGTAHDELSGLNIPMYGKTGTAQNPIGDPHAWFAGYTQTAREDKPDIAVVVLVENGGEGSEVAAPIFRRIIEVYYFGGPLKIYPWESSFNVTRTPTLKYTLTPTETPYREPTKEETPTPSG
ncbi:MAG TPA: hypothetical protein G4N92_03785 [Anaerolineae bacterium]|nr:hypothetical protein [Anaerolineae bacterium]